MSAARARRRLMRHERYRHRALLLGARPSLAVYSDGHATAFHQAVHTGRYYPIGIRREPWLVPQPKCWAVVRGPFGPIRCGFPADRTGRCNRCRRQPP